MRVAVGCVSRRAVTSFGGGRQSTVDAMTFKIRSNQPSPIPVLQGYVIGSSAAVSLMTTQPGAKAFGFIVKE